MRAAGLQTLDTIVQAIPSSAASDPHHTALLSPASALTATLLAVLKLTLSDNWSQVRMASSVLCRTYLSTVNAILDSNSNSSSSVALTPAAYAVLLPRMCLNRFYLAQGVKLYSQETWRIVFHTNGLPLIRTHAGAVARYYTRMADADNHVVREAACQAIAKLASKLGDGGTGAAALAPFVPLLLQALLVCFHDESWPVRDEACLACEIFVGSYPEECQPELPTLTERWTNHLFDQIWSVREDAARALGSALHAYPSTLQPVILELLRENIQCARKQPPQTRAGMLATHNDVNAHIDSQLYSCGSLAPKLRKGGCSNCIVTRERTDWERTDGCIYLLKELCCLDDSKQTAVSMGDDVLLPLLMELTDVPWSFHHLFLRQM